MYLVSNPVLEEATTSEANWTLPAPQASMLLDVVRVAGLVREVKGQGSSPPSYHFLGEVSILLMLLSEINNN